jgi:hypothetical protein
VIGGFLFFSLAAAKRSVYLLPLFPALALLIGAGVADPPAEGRVARAARFGASLYAPALLLLAALAAALALGFDAAAVARPWLKPRDAAGALVLASAARDAAPALGMLALLTAAVAPLIARAAAADRWRRIIGLVAMLAVVWTAAFNVLFHPAIAQQRSLRSFLARVERLVPPGAPLYAIASAKFRADPGLRFYASRPLRPWPRRGVPDGGHLLLWEDEWRVLRDPEGRSLTVLAVSDAVQSGRGHLALVDAPRGPLSSAKEPPAQPLAPGIRRPPERR